MDELYHYEMTIPDDECICIHGLPVPRTNHPSSDCRCSMASNRETQPIQSVCGFIMKFWARNNTSAVGLYQG